MRTTDEKNRLVCMAHATRQAANTAAAIPTASNRRFTLRVAWKRASSPAVIQVATGPSSTTTKTIGLSQFLPAFVLLRSASSSGLFQSRTMAAMPAAKLIASRIHAFSHERRPAEAKRHAAVMTKLKMVGMIRLITGESIACSPTSSSGIREENMVMIYTMERDPESLHPGYDDRPQAGVAAETA